MSIRLGLLLASLGLTCACGPRPYAQPLHDAIEAQDATAARRVLDDALANPKLSADRRGLALLERASLRLANEPPRAALNDLVEGDRLLEASDLESARSSKKKRNPEHMRRWERNGALRFLGKPLVLKPHERLYENVLGMAAAWAAGDDSAMRVEARRFALTRTDLHSYAYSSRAYDVLAAGGLLASYAFEAHTRSEACLFITEASRLNRASILEAQRAALCDQASPASERDEGGVRGLIIAGLAPLVGVETLATNHCFSLTERPPPPEPEVSVDGNRVNVELLVDFVPIAFDFWQITLQRAPHCGSAIGFGSDSWQTLPGRLFAFARPLSPGRHTLRVRVGEEEREHTFEVRAQQHARVVDSFPFAQRDAESPLRRLEATPPPPAR